MDLARKSGIGAQFGGKYFALDVRVIRLPRHGASCPVGIGVSCSADRNIKARIDRDGIWLEELERDPARFIPAQYRSGLGHKHGVEDRPQPADERDPRRTLEVPVSTPLKLTGTIVVARDIAHAKIKERLDQGEGMPDYLKEHPVYYAGPAKTPAGAPSGSFGPTTAGRMDSYVDLFQSHGGSMVMIAKGNRSQAVTDACKKHGGFYLGSIGGPAAHAWPRRTSRRSSCSSTPSSAWRPSTRSTSSISRPSSWSTTRATSSSRSYRCCLEMGGSDGHWSRNRWGTQRNSSRRAPPDDRG